MAQFLAIQIKLRRITINDVPERLKQNVIDILGISEEQPEE